VMGRIGYDWGLCRLGRRGGGQGAVWLCLRSMSSRFALETVIVAVVVDALRLSLEEYEYYGLEAEGLCEGDEGDGAVSVGRCHEYGWCDGPASMFRCINRHGWTVTV
jgi:hypothetical protein